MVQPRVEAAPEGFRQRHRRQRRQEFLDVALAIVASEGLPALTMARVTDEVGCATGSIYHYFGSKGALVAELELEAIQLLGRSLQESQAHLVELLEGGDADPQLSALTRVVVAASFWVAAEETFPREIDLCRRLFTEPGIVLADDEAAPVVPPAIGLLELARSMLDAAVDTGALRPGNNLERSVILLAGTTGVLLTSVLSRWDEQLFEGRRLADAMLTDLFTAWGADPGQLTFAEQVVSTLRERRQLVPAPAPAEIRLP